MAVTKVERIIREYFLAYERKDRSAVQSLLHGEFSFASPHDPYLDVTAYFERCWPNSLNTAHFTLRKLFVLGDEAFVLYDCMPRTGDVFSNTEFFRVVGAKIIAIQVFYGSLPTAT
jgi:ketosteroid isomerase-like protein